jgi:hypothetical protein
MHQVSIEKNTRNQVEDLKIRIYDSLFMICFSFNKGKI